MTISDEEHAEFAFKAGLRAGIATRKSYLNGVRDAYKLGPAKALMLLHKLEEEDRKLDAEQ